VPEIRFSVAKEVAPSEIANAVDEIWNDLKSDRDLRDDASTGGLDLKLIDAISSNPYEVKGAGQGLDPATIAVIVAFAPVAAEICRDVWRVVILPRLRQRFGQNSIRD
jgi:hypothetical protein